VLLLQKVVLGDNLFTEITREFTLNNDNLLCCITSDNETLHRIKKTIVNAGILV